MSALPNGWLSASLDSLCSRIVDGSHNPPKAVGEGFPMLSARNIQDRRINFDEFRFISRASFALENARTNLEAGDVLLTIVGAIGRTAVVPVEIEPFTLQRSVAVLKPQLINPHYLAYALESPVLQKYLFENAKGTAQKGIYLKALSQVEIPLAPLNEQKRIADKLDALLARVDACRERLDRVPLILKRFRQAVLAAATSGKLTESWQKENRCNFDEWKEVDVQSVAMVGTGSTPLRSNLRFFSNQGTPWITSAATGEPFVTKAQEFVTEEAVLAHRLKLYPIGTLLVAMYGEGKTRGQVAELAIEATINQACAAVVVDEAQAVKEFIKITLKANYLEMRELAEGGNQPR